MADLDLDINLENPEIPDPAHPRKKSGGELLFDRTVYTGIGFGVNELSSLWITDQFMHGKNLFAHMPSLKKIGAWFSEEGFHKASDAVAKLLKYKETIAKDGSVITPRAHGGNALLMVTLISGGTLLILPMKWLEDSKVYWVQKANHLLDHLSGKNMTADEVEARDKKVEQEIACSPRQSWPTMLLGRVIAVGSSMTLGTFVVGQDKNNRLMNWSEKLLTGSVAPKEQRTAGKRWARLLSVETYSCATSSIVLELMSKFFAKRGSNVHNPELCQKTAAKAAPAPTSTDDDTKTANGGGANYSAKIQSQKAMAAEVPLAI